MTAAIIDIADLRARRATGQPLFDRSSKVIPIHAPQPKQTGIIGLRVKVPGYDRIGTVAGIFETNGVTFARVYFGFGIFTKAVDCRHLEFVDGPECA